jgi:hypothetical protein
MANEDKLDQILGSRRHPGNAASPRRAARPARPASMRLTVELRRAFSANVSGTGGAPAEPATVRFFPNGIESSAASAKKWLRSLL